MFRRCGYDKRYSGGIMALHFDLKGLFLFVIGVMLWLFVLPYPLLGGGVMLGCYLLLRHKELSPVDGIFAVALLMNLWYVFSSLGNVRQYDYFNFVMFADYFIRNDFFVAQPISFFEEIYFQPPVWGLVSALVTRIGMLLGQTQEQAFDAVRLLSLFAVSGAMIIFWRLMGEFKFSDKVKLGLFAVFCFFPANTMAANLVNNDAMVYFLVLSAVYVSFLWYESGAWRQAFTIAGILFMAGMVKFSGLMVVPAIGVLGLCRLLNAEDKFASRLWGQFTVIGFSAVLGFGWGLFLMYFDLPLVPPPMNVGFQDLGIVPLVDRLLGIETAFYPFADVWHGHIEANVFIALLKTALFGEWGWAYGEWANMLYLFGGILALFLIGSFVTLWIYKLKGDFAFNLFCVVLVFSVLISWAGFWLEFPYFCSVEFRYVMILLPISLLWFGNWLTQINLPKWVGYASAGLITLFVLAKFMLYLHTI